LAKEFFREERIFFSGMFEEMQFDFDGSVFFELSS